MGKKKKPTYRFVVSEASKDLYGRHLEILGHYNPFTKVCEVKKDRILYWISKGAQPSPTAHNLLVDQNVIQAEKVKASKAQKKPKKSKEEGEKPTEGAPSKDAGKTQADPKAEKSEPKEESKPKPKEEPKKEPSAENVKEKPAETPTKVAEDEAPVVEEEKEKKEEPKAD